VKEQPMRTILLWAALVVVIVAAGCNSSASSGGEPKTLPPGRIPKGYGPTGK
jgi:hypothetical protein